MEISIIIRTFRHFIKRWKFYGRYSAVHKTKGVSGNSKKSYKERRVLYVSRIKFVLYHNW